MRTLSQRYSAPKLRGLNGRSERRKEHRPIVRGYRNWIVPVGSVVIRIH